MPEERRRAAEVTPRDDGVATGASIDTGSLAFAVADEAPRVRVEFEQALCTAL